MNIQLALIPTQNGQVAILSTILEIKLTVDVVTLSHLLNLFLIESVFIQDKNYKLESQWLAAGVILWLVGHISPRLVHQLDWIIIRLQLIIATITLSNHVVYQWNLAQLTSQHVQELKIATCFHVLLSSVIQNTLKKHGLKIIINQVQLPACKELIK